MLNFCQIPFKFVVTVGLIVTWQLLEQWAQVVQKELLVKFFAGFIDLCHLKSHQSESQQHKKVHVCLNYIFAFYLIRQPRKNHLVSYLGLIFAPGFKIEENHLNDSEYHVLVKTETFQKFMHNLHFSWATLLRKRLKDRVRLAPVLQWAFLKERSLSGTHDISQNQIEQTSLGLFTACLD